MKHFILFILIVLGLSSCSDVYWTDYYEPRPIIVHSRPIIREYPRIHKSISPQYPVRKPGDFRGRR
jgi:hypothetical protein